MTLETLRHDLRRLGFMLVFSEEDGSPRLKPTRASAVASPETISWLASKREAILKRYGERNIKFFKLRSGLLYYTCRFSDNWNNGRAPCNAVAWSWSDRGPWQEVKIQAPPVDDTEIDG